MSIIERITQIMDTKNLNQSDLCKILGIKDSTFSTWKTRGTDPPAKYILLICEYLGVSVDYLLGRVDEDNLILSNEEKQLVLAYRNQPEMKQAVNKLLGIAESPPIVQTKRRPIDQLVVKDERIACYETEQIGQPVSKEKEAEAKKLANQLKEREQKENEELKKLFEKARESQKDIF